MNEDGNGGTFDGFGTVGRWERECCWFMWTERDGTNQNFPVRNVERSGTVNAQER